MPPTPSEEIEPVKSKPRAIPLQNYLTDGVYYDTLYTEADRVNEMMNNFVVWKMLKLIILRNRFFKNTQSNIYLIAYGMFRNGMQRKSNKSKSPNWRYVVWKAWNPSKGRKIPEDVLRWP